MQHTRCLSVVLLAIFLFTVFMLATTCGVAWWARSLHQEALDGCDSRELYLKKWQEDCERQSFELSEEEHRVHAMACPNVMKWINIYDRDEFYRTRMSILIWKRLQMLGYPATVAFGMASDIRDIFVNEKWPYWLFLFLFQIQLFFFAKCRQQPARPNHHSNETLALQHVQQQQQQQQSTFARRMRIQGPAFTSASRHDLNRLYLRRHELDPLRN